MQKKNIQEGFGDQSQTKSWINSEGTDFNFERQEDRTRAPMNCFSCSLEKSWQLFANGQTKS